MSAAIPPYRIGTAGWQLPKPVRRPDAEGTQLQQYAQLFRAVEINSTFYRPHRPATFERWAASVPDDLRFAVKLHRSITHERRLRVGDAVITAFLDMVSALGKKLGPVLIQLPPSLAFNATAEEFLAQFRGLYAGEAVIEPRHPSWAVPEVDHLLVRSRIARVAADPPVLTGTVQPGGHRGLAYFRLHGSPRVYWSDYEEQRLQAFADLVRRAPAPAWVILDNTAAGAAAPNALRLQELLRS